MNKPEQPWYALSISEIMDCLDANKNGLNNDNDIKQRRLQFGLNKLPSAKPHPAWLRFLQQFNNVLIYILLAASIMTFFLGHIIDTVVIMAVIFINALIGFIQEGKAQRSLEALSKLMPEEATVRRQSKLIKIPAEELVIGDILILKSGDRVPADIRLIESMNFWVEEAILTGESQPQQKSTNVLSGELTLPECSNMVFSGTWVTEGRCIGVVVETGQNTEVGKINALLQTITPMMTPLIKQINTFSAWLTFCICTLGIFTVLYGWFIFDKPLTEMLLAAVGLIVAAIPEGLPAIITITLAIGVHRMSREKALIRRLPAVETLGAVTHILSDKTGTLTVNELTATHVIFADETYEITGVGYHSDGQWLSDSRTMNTINEQVWAFLTCAMCCNDAELHWSNNNWHWHGHPTDVALLFLIQKVVSHREDLMEPNSISETPFSTLFEQSWQRIDEIPFQSTNKRMVVSCKLPSGKVCLFVKGAPEQLIDHCTEESMKISKDDWHKTIEDHARLGHRLLGFAYCWLDDINIPIDEKVFDLSWQWIGVCSFVDPPREEAKEAVKLCQNAGITVKMVTGDHAATAKAIANELGIKNNGMVVTGKDLLSCDEEKIKELALQAAIFARTTPEDKLKLVSALQDKNCIVAMTGDGVNDAPALKKANIGVAMGIKGTPAAKEAAEMVITNDSFDAIVSAVACGRTVYDNIIKAINFILPTNGGEALVIIGAILFGLSLPITPVQILWVNMITAVTLALSISFEPQEESVMHRLPRSPSQGIITPFLIWRVLFVSILLVCGVFGLFLWELQLGASLETARTVAVNTLVAGEIAYLFNSRRQRGSTLSWNEWRATPKVWAAVTIVIVFQILYCLLPVAHIMFNSTELSIEQVSKIITFAFLVYIIVELEKWIGRKYLNWR